MTVQERIEGALLAHAAGDALGAPLEFLGTDAIVAQYGELRDIVGGGLFDWRPGQGTDDTDLSTIAIESLVDRGGYDRDDVAQRLIAWASGGPRDIGTTTARAISNLAASVDPSGIDSPNSASNGSLMRALAPGLAITDPEERRCYADELSAITHAAPDCRSACVAYAEIVNALVEGTDVESAIATAQQLGTLSEGVVASLRPPTLAHVALDMGGSVTHSLAVAIGALRDGDRIGLEEAIIAVANRGGDADTNAAIAGGLLGARHGAQAVPRRWREALEQRTRLVSLADELASLRAST